MPAFLALLLTLLLTARAQESTKGGWPHSAEDSEAEAPEAEAADAEEPDIEDEGQDLADPRARFLASSRAMSRRLQRAFPDGHPEPNYRFAAEIYAQIAPLVEERPGVIRPEILGLTVKGRPIWAFRVSRPGDEIHARILVFGGIHALEWISSEVATSFLLDLARHPARGVEVVVIPILNLDGRHRVEQDLRHPGPQPYRRGNARGVDLNRDYEVNRSSEAIWKRIVPGYYHTSPAPLSQPESQALDRLVAQGFDVSVSLHAFGGYVYYPWSGLWDRPPHWKEHALLGDVMVSGMASRPYQSKQLARWGFFFRALGTELDHMYGRHGTYSFLIELTRSGIEPLHPKTWKNYFRWYNPADPTEALGQGVGALRALVGYASFEGLPPRPSPPFSPEDSQ